MLAVLGGDFLQHVVEGGFVGGVVAHDFVAERQAVGGDDEGDDDLEAVGALVAALAEGFEIAGLGDFAGGIDFELAAPALLKMGEEVGLVIEEAVVAFVEGVFGDEAEVVIQQIGEGALIEPQAVEPPLAAG